MNTLDRIHQQIRNRLNVIFQSTLELIDNMFRSVSLLMAPENSIVSFPEDEPFTVVTEKGSVRLEPIAFAAFRYCWYVFLLEGRNEITFAELGEKIYKDPLKPKSTIQNTVKRGESVESIGVVYFYSGEKIFLEDRITH